MIDYKDSGREEHVRILTDFEIRIVKINSNITKIYFTRDDKVIDVPDGMTCYETSDANQESVVEIDGIQCFLVVWMNDYEFYQGDDVILSLTSQRSHVIKVESV